MSKYFILFDKLERYDVRGVSLGVVKSCHVVTASNTLDTLVGYDSWKSVYHVAGAGRDTAFCPL